jgi:hypothetical protein
MQLMRTQSGVAGSSRACVREPRLRRMRVAAEATTKQKAPPSTTTSSSNGLQQTLSDLGGLGDALGPIGLSYSASAKVCRLRAPISRLLQRSRASRLNPCCPLCLQERPSTSNRGEGEASTSAPQSIARMSTEEWRTKYEQDGTVDLWLEDEFNAGSRLVVRHTRPSRPHTTIHSQSASRPACNACRLLHRALACRAQAAAAISAVQRPTHPKQRLHVPSPGAVPSCQL